jgi:hypothetical protein
LPGGNFDADSAASYPALLDFLKEQEFADKLAKVAFAGRARTAGSKTFRSRSSADKLLAGTCMTAAALADRASATRAGSRTSIFPIAEATKKRGFATVTVSIRPCEIHKASRLHVGPNGPLTRVRFTGEPTLDWAYRRCGRLVMSAAERLEPGGAGGDCAFIPVCAGGQFGSPHTELGDMNMPTCRRVRIGTIRWRMRRQRVLGDNHHGKIKSSSPARRARSP